MDLFIETLTGTAFELRVSPFETIMNVKAKIQRLEGIPISQQHLIWRSMELEDDRCLHDYHINDGATLQLVLAMRGGPINMKRVPVEDNSLREMAEYVEANRDEIWDKLPKDNRQVTFLVFRDGEQYNVYRVVDRGDGTLTPLSDSLSGASLYNLYDEDDEENSVTVPQETIQENNVTMNKMKLLRSKMESLHTSKKSRGGATSVEQVSFQPHSPPPATSFVYKPRPPSKEKHPKYQPRPPSGEKPKTASLASRRRLRRTSSSLREQDDHDNTSISHVHPTDMKVHAHESSTAMSKALPPVNKTKNSNNIDISELVRNPSEDTSFHSKTLSKHFQHEGGSKKSLHMSHELNYSSQRSSNVLNTSIGSTKSHGLCSNHGLSFSNRLNSSHGHHKPLPNVRKHSDNSIECGVDGARHSEHIESSLEARLASVGHAQSKGYTTSGGKGVGALKERKTSVERLRSGLLNDSLSRVHRTQQSSAGTLYSTTDVARSRPPPPPQLASGKKTRCTFCRKKTGLASTYVCRCGNSFCATHRYAETHNCNYDYKTEGRKLLEQSNPLVVAPKLPKI